MRPLTHTLRTESLAATFRLAPQLLGVSLRHRGVELLRQVDDLERLAIRGDPCGIAMLHPWANRLEQHGYRAAGAEVALAMHSPLLRADAHGLPLHGVPWSLLPTSAPRGDGSSCRVRIDWRDDRLLEIFPFRHSLDFRASVEGSALTITTELRATGTEHVPVSFGFHPYFGLPGLTRRAWRLGLPERRHIQLDARGLPTGGTRLLSASHHTLGNTSHDDAFALTRSTAEFSIADDSRQISLHCVDGYTHVQLYAPPDQAFVCIEPMTAPVNALCSGGGLRTVAPSEVFSATFRLVVSAH